jgi:hypothetical protein
LVVKRDEFFQTHSDLVNGPFLGSVKHGSQIDGSGFDKHVKGVAEIGKKLLGISREIGKVVGKFVVLDDHEDNRVV